MKKLNKAGFTIIELMIASMVFTTVLLLCMEGITRIVKVYVKNASVTRTSEFTKSFIESISEQVKYGSSDPEVAVAEDGTTYLCFSSNTYKVVLNNKDPSSIKKKSNQVNCTYFDNIANYEDAESVAPANTRVLGFEVSDSGSSGLWRISMRVALGDDDLLVDDTGKSIVDTGVELSTVKCKSGISGSEYCAVIELSTVASRRL